MRFREVQLGYGRKVEAFDYLKIEKSIIANYCIGTVFKFIQVHINKLIDVIRWAVNVIDVQALLEYVGINRIINYAVQMKRIAHRMASNMNV